MRQSRQIALTQSKSDCHGHRRCVGQCGARIGTDELVGRTSASASGRALVPTACSGHMAQTAPPQQPLATFLTQLIATAQQLAQTRARRRAPPDEASSAYAAIRAAIGSRGAAKAAHHLYVSA